MGPAKSHIDLAKSHTPSPLQNDDSAQLGYLRHNTFFLGHVSTFAAITYSNKINSTPFP